MAADDDETLPTAFWAVARQLRRLSRASLAPWDLTPSQSRALSVLTRHGVLRLTDLSAHLHIAPRSTTEVVDSLQERGLAERRPEPSDRRVALVALTDEGERVGQAIRSAREAEGERYFDVLSASDRAHLAALLCKLRSTA